MTRRNTAWWAGFVPTPPGAFIGQPEGDRLLDLLAEWWIAEEGLLHPRPPLLEHTRRAVSRRYRQADLYQRLAESGFPELSDRDEHAVDTVLRVFIGWASSPKAGELAVVIEQKGAARSKILRGLDAGARSVGAPRGLGLTAHQRSHDEFDSLAVYEVHEQVAARARAQVKAAVKEQLRAEL